jgi:poly(3-hydroxybutyrate) depolymerase
MVRGSAALSAAALGVTVLATHTAHGRAAKRTLAEFAHARLWWRGDRRRVPGHAMQYLLTAPRRGEPRAAIITLDGADHDFVWNSATFGRACRNRPFVVATPYIVSNGGRADAAYPYSTAELAPALASPLAFDSAGVAALAASLQAEYNLSAMYLAAYSAGGHLGWKLALDTPNLWSGVALACANFAGRGLATSADAESPHVSHGFALKIRGFQGALDSRRAVLYAQWMAGAHYAESRGFTGVSYESVPDAGHSPCADAVVAWYTTLLEGQDVAPDV